MIETSAVQLDQGTFVLSFDFELAWGTRGRPSASTVGPNLDGTRRAIDGLLGQFEKYDISATWVVVGAMFLGGTHRHRWLDDASYDDVPVGDCLSEPHWYAEDILRQLIECPAHQEIGSHTLTHMFVQEDQASRQQFDQELKRSCELFRTLDLPSPSSFIFPKHFMSHFDLLREHGFTCYRGPESGWFERLPHPLMRAGGRLAWARLRRPPVIDRPFKTKDGLWRIPSSQYYPGFQNVGKYITMQDRIAKGIRGLDLAARQRGVHHLWTHPFNLGMQTDALLRGTEAILQHFDKLRQAGKMDNLTMGDLAARCESALSTSSVHATT